MASIRGMEPRHTFEWDVLNQPSLPAWFDRLRAEGWFRDPDVPGVKTSTGTIVYAFHYLGAAEQRGA